MRRSIIDSAIGSIEGAMLVAREALAENFERVKDGDMDYAEECKTLTRELGVLDDVLHQLQEFKRKELGKDEVTVTISISDYS